jgi:phosphoglycolate phosphatase
MIIFDLDGTVLDTAPDVHRCINEALSIMGLSPLTLEQTKTAIGPAGRHSFSTNVLGPNHEHRVDEFIQIFRPIYFDGCCIDTKPFDGVTELLETLSGTLPMVVASNKSQPYSEKILDCLNLRHYFEFVIGPERVQHPKPAPDMLTFGMERLQVSPNDVLMVGDTDNDILAAQAVPMDACGVSWGYMPPSDLADLNPTFMIKAPSELIEKIQISSRISV